MFKKFWGGLKDLGKRAIGYIKGMNGHKAVSYLFENMNSLLPGISTYGKPLSDYLGRQADSLIDRLDQNLRENTIESTGVYGGGIRKPGMIYRRTAQPGQSY